MEGGRAYGLLSCQQGLPKLDPEVDISVVQLVRSQTSRKEIESLYYKVYKLWKLLGSPPREPELIVEVVSSLEECQGWKRGKLPQMTRKPKVTNAWSSRSRTPQRVRRDASVERSLAEVREAHQKALAMVATLEEEIEQLRQSLIRSWSET